MTLEQALEKANEGGWKTTLEPYRSLSEAIALALLDPLFWQALGKSMGWKKKFMHKGVQMAQEFEGWHCHWIDFTHHLAEGGTIESYFEKL